VSVWLCVRSDGGLVTECQLRLRCITQGVSLTRSHMRSVLQLLAARAAQRSTVSLGGGGGGGSSTLPPSAAPGTMEQGDGDGEGDGVVAGGAGLHSITLQDFDGEATGL